MLLREEKMILKKAADIIENQLANGTEVAIAGFGIFKLSPITVNLNSPGEDAPDRNVKQNKVAFRPYTQLKERVRNRRSL